MITYKIMLVKYVLIINALICIYSLNTSKFAFMKEKLAPWI